MTRKTFKIVLPTIIGLLLVIICLQLHQTFIDKFYEEDAVIYFEPLFDIDLYLILYLPILAIGILFQFFVILRLWDNYNKKMKYFHLRLLQLVLLSCLLFGIVMGLFTWYSRIGVTDLILQSLVWTGLAIVYRTGNLLTMRFIDRRQYGS